MYEGSLIFAQLMDFVPKRDFDDAVNHYNGLWRLEDGTFSRRACPPCY
jgi:hypothetical protein